jgi:ABC-2 type transport system permease protein
MLASIGLWIFFFFFMSMIAEAIANVKIPIDQNSSAELIARYYELEGAIGRVSPCNLYGEAIIALLNPEVGSFNPAVLIISTLIGGRMLSPLPFGQSLLLIWPQLVSIIALAAICFAASYIRFMREEIRSI